MQAWRRKHALSEAKFSTCKKYDVGAKARLTCSRCAELLPHKDFEDDALNRCLADNRMGQLFCVRCALGPERKREWRHGFYPCATCSENKERREYAPVVSKRHPGKVRGCESCRSPLCNLCMQRPDNAEHRGWPRVRKRGTETPPPFTCMTCKYPACDTCKLIPRPQRIVTCSIEKLPKWSCSDCRYELAFLLLMLSIRRQCDYAVE